MTATIAVRVHPRARRTGISAKLGDAYKLDIAAPAVDGKANDACIAYLSELTAVPKSAILILSGAHNKSKILRFEGISPENLKGKLDSAL